MEAHQTLALSFTDSRPKTHHHTDSRGSSSNIRTLVPSKGPKVKDSMQGRPASSLQDSGLKQPLKTHTPQTQKDFLIWMSRWLVFFSSLFFFFFFFFFLPYNLRRGYIKMFQSTAVLQRSAGVSHFQQKAFLRRDTATLLPRWGGALRGF